MHSRTASYVQRIGGARRPNQGQCTHRPPATWPPSNIRRFQANNWDGAMTARRARRETLIPGCVASSTSRTFSEADHRRRRCTDVFASILERGSSGDSVQVVFIGVCRCLIGYPNGPVKMGHSSAGDEALLAELLSASAVRPYAGRRGRHPPEDRARRGARYRVIGATFRGLRHRPLPHR